MPNFYSSNNSEEINETVVNYVESIGDAFRRINEITTSVDFRELTTSKLDKSHSHEEVKNQTNYTKLQEQFNELEINYESANNNLAESEKSVDKLHNELNDISLQVKIVSQTFQTLLKASKYLINSL